MSSPRTPPSAGSDASADSCAALQAAQTSPLKRKRADGVAPRAFVLLPAGTAIPPCFPKRRRAPPPPPLRCAEPRPEPPLRCAELPLAAAEPPLGSAEPPLGSAEPPPLITVSSPLSSPVSPLPSQPPSSPPPLRSARQPRRPPPRPAHPPRRAELTRSPTPLAPPHLFEQAATPEGTYWIPAPRRPAVRNAVSIQSWEFDDADKGPALGLSPLFGAQNMEAINGYVNATVHANNGRSNGVFAPYTTSGDGKLTTDLCFKFHVSTGTVSLTLTTVHTATK